MTPQCGTAEMIAALRSPGVKILEPNTAAVAATAELGFRPACKLRTHRSSPEQPARHDLDGRRARRLPRPLVTARAA
ncbi:hypothetical protein [Streptomyces sp. NPDC020983]|uniref:hypothetical protein n=1 Tax=Streptomyces sp. NPDC020983 TaxID=3365106 RepID=UPI0037954D94